MPEIVNQLVALSIAAIMTFAHVDGAQLAANQPASAVMDLTATDQLVSEVIAPTSATDADQLVTVTDGTIPPEAALESAVIALTPAHHADQLATAADVTIAPEAALVWAVIGPTPAHHADQLAAPTNSSIAPAAAIVPVRTPKAAPVKAQAITHVTAPASKPLALLIAAAPTRKPAAAVIPAAPAGKPPALVIVAAPASKPPAALVAAAPASKAPAPVIAAAPATATAVPPPAGEGPCQPVQGETYGSLSITGGPADRPAAEHADLNLGRRGWNSSNAALSLQDYGGPTDRNAPRFSGLFGPARSPQMTAGYQVYNWDFGSGQRTTPIGNPAITLLGFATSQGEIIHVPNGGYSIGSGFATLVLYAEPARITLKYTREDSVAVGYTVHIENVCVDPQLLGLYRTLNGSGRSQLPALRNGQALGSATGSQILVGIQDSGTWMDPRSRKDWWQ